MFNMIMIALIWLVYTVIVAIFIKPSMMASDSGTKYAMRLAYTLMGLLAAIFLSATGAAVIGGYKYLHGVTDTFQLLKAFFVPAFILMVYIDVVFFRIGKK